MKALILATFLAASLSAHASVWETVAQWDDVQDAAFSQWIEDLSLDIFVSPSSPYRGIETDCAEAAYTLRTIFAFQHGLPVNYVGDGSHGLSNDSNRFDSEPEGTPRLRAFIEDLKTHISTETLVRDSYPIAINRKFLKAGVLFLHPKTTDQSVSITYRDGHVYYVQSVPENGMIHYFSSTVPARPRNLQPRIDINFMPFENTGGFRAWNRPGHPGESMEQFKIGGWRPADYRDEDNLWESWQAAIHRSIALRAPTALEVFQAKLFNINGYVKERSELVELSWRVYQTKYRGRGCMNPATDYDSYSTPTRDKKIQTELEDLKTATVNYLRSRGQNSSDEAVARVFAGYQYEVVPGRRVDLNSLWQTFESTLVLAISEPEHSPLVRWGLETQSHWPCPDRAKQYVGGELVRQN